MIRSNDFRNAGYATAAASFHTLNWAAANRDSGAWLKAAGLEPQARQRADELFAQMPEAIRQRYGSVDASGWVRCCWVQNGCFALPSS
jgi:hypothetical protein